MKNDWDLESAIATYNVDAWGGGYFTVNPNGNVVAKPAAIRPQHVPPEEHSGVIAANPKHRRSHAQQ